MKQPRMVVRVILLLSVLAMVAAACGNDNGGGTGGAKATSVVWGTTDSVTSNDPAKCYEFFCGNVAQVVYSRLVSYPAEGSDIKPDAASKLPEVSSDGLTYTFTLKDGLKFSDGSALDSAAVKYSIDRVVNLKISGSAAFLITDSMKSVAAPDAKTVVFTLKQPDATFLSKLTFNIASIVNPKVIAADKVADNKTIGGSAWYKMDPSGYVEGQSMRLDANSYSIFGAPKTKTILIKFFKSSSALKLALQNKEVDVAFHTFLPTEVKDLKANSAITTTGPGLGRIRFLVQNVKQKPFDNENVRKAVAASLSRAKLIEDAFDNTVTPLYSMLRSSFGEYKDVFKTTYGDTVDKTKVDKYLADAGIAAGTKVPITLWASTNHYGDSEQDAQESIRRQLEETGRFTVTSKTEDWAAFRPDLAAPPSGKFGLFLLGWFPDYFDPDDYFSPFIGTDGAKSQGSFFSDASVDAKIKQEQGSTDQAVRGPIFTELQQLIADKALYVPLWEEAEYIFTQKSVTGSKLDLTSFLRVEELVKAA